MTTLRLSNQDPAAIKADAVVVGLTDRSGTPALTSAAASVDERFEGKLARIVAELGGSAKAESVTKLPAPPGVAAAIVVVVGLGAEPKDAEPYEPELLRRAAGAAIRALAGTGTVALALPAADAASVAALADGALLGAYAFTRYRQASKAGQKAPVRTVTVLSDKARERGMRAVAERASAVSECVNWARDLINTPPSDLHPEEFAGLTKQAVEGLEVSLTVLDERGLKRGKYGGILGVGQGSVNGPRLVKIDYRPRGANGHLALVGKGITFDSGGLSLKPPNAMTTMKCDMSGAAAVVAAITAIARLRLPVRVTAWAPLAENMPSGAAQRPSDVLTIFGGKTVEVLNTDAEGRLVLADALVAASADKPDLIVDVATLTGAQVIALGNRTAAIMSNDDSTRDGVHAASRRAGEQMWPMPLPPELRASMDSQVADIANIGDRFGGMLVAGLFLSEFVGDGLKWAHLDIAGPAFNEGSPFGYTPKGGTGAAVRTLVQIAGELSEGKFAALPG